MTFDEPDAPVHLNTGLRDVTHAEGVQIVMLAADENAVWQLMLQRADALDDQDRDFGMDTYGIVSGWQEGARKIVTALSHVLAMAPTLDPRSAA